jgi:hypothetical protein
VSADDFVTVLTAKGRRATKLIQPAMDRSIWPSKEIPGQLDIIGYEHMTIFRGGGTPGLIDLRTGAAARQH